MSYIHLTAADITPFEEYRQLFSAIPNEQSDQARQKVLGDLDHDESLLRKWHAEVFVAKVDHKRQQVVNDATTLIQTLDNEQQFDRGCEKLAVEFFEARRPFTAALDKVQHFWLDYLTYCQQPNEMELVRTKQQLKNVLNEFAEIVHKSRLGDKFLEFESKVDELDRIFLHLIKAAIIQDQQTIESLISTTPQFVERHGWSNETEKIIDQILCIWSGSVRNSWRKRVQTLADVFLIDLEVHFSPDQGRTKINRNARGFLHSIVFPIDRSHQMNSHVQETELVVAESPPVVQFLEQWALNDRLAGKFIPGWEGLANDCRNWHVALNGSEAYLPVIAELFSSLTQGECTEDRITAYLFKFHGIKPTDALGMTLNCLADLLRNDLQIDTQMNLNNRPSEAPAPPDGPALAKTMIIEALTGDNKGRLRDGSKLTVTLMERRLRSSGVQIGRTALYENQEYADVRALAKPLGLFNTLPRKREPAEAARRGSKSKLTGQVETKDDRELPPDQIVR